MNDHDADPERTLPATTQAETTDSTQPFSMLGEPGGAAVITLADDAAKPASRRRKVLTLGLAATVLLAVGAGGGALAAVNLDRTQQTTSATLGGRGAGSSQGGSSSGSTSQGSTSGGTSGGPSSGFGGPGGSFGGSSQGGSSSGGFSQGGFSSGGSSSSGTSTSSGTAATAAQTVGVVTVVTTLGYESGEAAGTGIILSSTGRILTNNHVIDGATAIKVTVETTGKTYTAKVVGTDATDDVAVLQLQHASGLTAATLATTKAAVGDAVTAVGNAGGTGTLTAAKGTVTALKQSITTEAEGSSASEKLTGLIETDADVVSGDSGGPLKNASGAVVGIDTAASSGSSDVTGYAIPISTALTIAEKIVAGEKSSKITLGYPAFLGISVAATSSSSTTGATIGEVIKGTPAASTALVAGDVITSVNGSSIASAEALTKKLESYSPGTSVKIGYTDEDGASHTLQVTLTTGPAD